MKYVKQGFFPGALTATVRGCLILVSALSFSAPSRAITVTQNDNALSLASAVTAGTSGLIVTSASLSGQTDGIGALSTGTYANPSNTYGIGPGIVLSTGNVSNYADGPNTSDSTATDYDSSATTAQEALLDPITGGTFNHFDVTQLDLTFDSSTGKVFFLGVFGTEEYPELIGSPSIDAFGLYLNGVNIAQSGGIPINVNHPAMAALAGTELDGVLAPGNNPVLLFSGPANPTGNTLSFIIADTSDGIFDATVYISSLSDVNPVPVPAAVWLFGSGLLGLIGVARRKAGRNA